MEAHHGLAPEASRRLDARLVLLLANHIGDVEVVQAAIAEAGRGAAPDPAPREARLRHDGFAPGPHQGQNPWTP